MKNLTLFLFIFASLSARAYEIPRDIALGSSNFTDRTLNAACFGMDALIEGLPCNPAFTAKERQRQFQGQFFFGNNISYIHEVSRLLDGSGNPETVQKLFSQKSSSEAEASIQASYLQETWGVQFAPYRLFYYALIRNPALPTVTLYTGQEQSVSAQLASFYQGNWYWGLQMRGVDRRFIMSEFTLTDALASGGSQYFETQNQRALYLEPGLLYEWADKDWKPQLGLTIKNAGFVDTKYDELPMSPDWHLAGSIHPPVGLGELELGLDLEFNSYIEEAREVPHLGASYKLGAMQALASYADTEYSLGFLLHYDNWNGGLTYWRKKYINLLGDKDQLQTVYLELGFTI